MQPVETADGCFGISGILIIIYIIVLIVAIVISIFIINIMSIVFCFSIAQIIPVTEYQLCYNHSPHDTNVF